MSIHTILSQMEQSFDKKFTIGENGDWLPLMKAKSVKQFFRSFAIRIVEEAKREERERIIKLQKEVEDKKWIDAEHCSCLAYAIDIIENPDSDRIFLASNKSTGTKLQKMKENL